MIVLRWLPYPESDVVSYNVYRSIIGFRGKKNVNVVGKTLELKLNGETTAQVVTFSGDVVDDINNAITGGRAFVDANDADYFIFRSDLREAPGSVEIVGGTALSDLLLTAKLITEKSDVVQIANVPANSDPTAVIEYEDANGVLQDWYSVSTVDSNGTESLRSNMRQPVTSSGPICIIEGLIINLQGCRIADSLVTAELVVPPENLNAASISKDKIETRSGTDGRFSLPVLQSSLVKLEIPDIGYTQMVRIPEAPYVFLNDLEVDLDYQYKSLVNNV